MKHLALLAVVVSLGLTTAASAVAVIDPPEPPAAAPDVSPEIDVAVLTGRWKLFFGAKICWGEVVNLPGESQCI